MKLSELADHIVVAVLMIGVSTDTFMSRMGAVIAVCMLRNVGKWTDDIGALYFVYNMSNAGMLNNFGMGGMWQSMQTSNLYLGGICAIYGALNRRGWGLPDMDLGF